MARTARTLANRRTAALGLPLVALCGVGGALLAQTASAAGPETTDLVSIDRFGGDADATSTLGSVSGDGTKVVFASDATDLVPNDTNNSRDVFVRDTTTGSTTRVSVATGGAQADKGGTDPAISKNGRFVAFESGSPDLIAADGNASQDVFVHDLKTGTTTRVSVADDEDETSADSGDPSISADGTRIAFMSEDMDLVSGVGLNGSRQVFVRDTATNSTQFVSADTGGSVASTDVFDPQISSDGGHVAFTSGATDLVPGDSNLIFDVFVRDLALGQTTRVSVKSGGGQVTGTTGSSRPRISDDGTKIAFLSGAVNLVPNDLNSASDVFLRDTAADVTTRQSLGPGGSELPNGAEDPSISGNGGTVGFATPDSVAALGDINAFDDVYVRSVATGDLRRASVAASGDGAQDGNSNLSDRGLSTDGSRVVFDSAATNLFSGDGNGAADVFLRRPVDPPAPPAPPSGPGAGAAGPGATGPGASPSASVSPPAAPVRKCRGKVATIVGTPGNDVLRGTRRADVIVGLGGRDRIIGGRGNDTICAGPGRDVVFAGRGRDVVLGQAGRDVIRGQRGRDLLFGGAQRDRLFGNQGRDVLVGGRGRDFGRGGPGRDRFRSIEIRRA